MKLPRLCLSVMLAALLLEGCASLVVGGAAGGGNQGARDPRSAGEISTDATITSAINTQYVNDELIDALDVRVNTYRGVVTLSGTLGSRAAATRAVELARTTHNVKRVISRIVVSP